MEPMQKDDDQLFLLTLSDTLRAESGVEAVGNRAAQLMAQRLGADRVYLVTLNPDDDIVVVTHEIRRQDLLPLQGSYHSSDFPAAIQEMFEHTIVYTDVRTDVRLTDLDRLSFAGLGAVGFMATAIRLGSQTMIWAAGAVSTQPRSWTASEVRLFEDAVERTWAAIERARTEEALRQSEEKYRQLFNSIDEGYALFELIYDGVGKPVDLVYVETNPTFDRINGFSGTGKKLSEILGYLEPFWYELYDRVLKTGEPMRVKYQTELTGAWYSVFCSRIVGEDNLRVAAIFNDITDQKRHEQQQAYLLTLSEALRSIADPIEIEETVTRLAMQQFGADRCYYCRIEAGDAIISRDARQSDLPSVAGTYPLSSFALLKRVVDAGQPFVVNDAATTPILDETIRAICLQLQVISFMDVPVMKNGQAVGVLCTVQSTPRHWTQTEVQLAIETAERTWEAVERAKAEAALRQSEEKYRTLFNSIDEGVITIELIFDQNGHVVDLVYKDFNASHTRLTGLAKDTIGKRVSEVLPNYEQFWFDTWERIARTGQSERVQHGVAELGNRWYDLYASRIGGAGSRQLVAVYNDITERKRAEESQKEANRRKDEFLAMLAHELRNPMSTIRSGLQILTITDGKDKTTHDTLAMMNRQTDHLVSMVDELLDVSRISQGKIELKKQRLNLVEVVAHATESVGTLYQEQGRRLQVNLPHVPMEVEGDVARLNQVITNLLTNGVRYTEESGQVWLSLSHQSGPSGGPEAILEVRDDGIGLAADQLKAIFDLFVQVDNSLARSKGGLGLGLTLVKRLVEMHGGRVEAQSEGLGRGSTFRVYLPTLKTAAEFKEKRAPQALDPTATSRILVIDDNQDAALIMATLLKLKGYETHTRTSSRAGLEAAESLQPAAILLDLGMPGMNGYETCQQLRQQPWGQNVVVIALTGYGQEEDRQRTKEAGFDGHLVKPVDLEVLTTLLNDLLGKRNKSLK